MKQIIDLSAHVNKTVLRGSAPPVQYRDVEYSDRDGHFRRSDRYKAIVRTDTDELISVVSNRYTLVPHTKIIDAVEQAVSGIDNDAPRGVFFEKGGARMRALFKFPKLSRELAEGDELCPVVRITNSYDTSSRAIIEMGAFRFVCTNFAIGGGGVFFGGFSSIHSGEINIDRMGQTLNMFLGKFDSIMGTFRKWRDDQWTTEDAAHVKAAVSRIGTTHALQVPNVGHDRFSAYNALTNYGTHKLRSSSLAFRFLETVNRTFQELN